MSSKKHKDKRKDNFPLPSDSIDSLKEFIQSLQEKREEDKELFKPERLEHLRKEDLPATKHSYGLG